MSVNPDYAARQRSVALRDACDMTRRAAAAALAASHGEPNHQRAIVLADANERLCAVLRGLQALG